MINTIKHLTRDGDDIDKSMRVRYDRPVQCADTNTSPQTASLCKYLSSAQQISRSLESLTLYQVRKGLFPYCSPAISAGFMLAREIQSVGDERIEGIITKRIEMRDLKKCCV